MKRHLTARGARTSGNRISFLRWMLAGAMLMGMGLLGAPCQAALTLVATASQVVVGNDVQRVTFTKGGDGKFHLTTDVLHDGAWVPLFDAGRPLIEGSLFNLEPTAYTVLEDSATRKLIQFQGSSSSPANVWDIAIEARADTPLIYFQIASHFTNAVTLPDAQPTVALWMNQPGATLQLDQGPPSPMQNVTGVPFGFGFPAAYLWQGQKQAMVFFNMTPMTWMSASGICRFDDVQIKTLSSGGQTGLGMHPRKKTGSTIRAGEMLVTFFLYSSWREEQPSKFEALDTMLQLCAPLHASDSTFPTNTLTGQPVTWGGFTQQAISEMSLQGTFHARLSTAWDDAPLYLTTLPTTMIVHPDQSGVASADLASAWNFSSVNAHLTPWTLYARMNSGADPAGLAALKRDALPRFYDSVAKMFCSGTRQPSHVFAGKEITWQSLVYYQEVLQACEAFATPDFNPAILGRLLMGTKGLIDYAHTVDYVFSTYFDPISKQPLIFSEIPGLGTLREPWSVGSYAYIMLRCYAQTNDARFLTEARTSLDTLLNTMSYTEANDYFTATYSEPMDMPLMELMGNAYGAVAAWQLYESSGAATYRRASRDFLNTLLRMAYWYEDNTDAISQELHNDGLFIPFGGADTTTAWETTEANLCLAWLLQHDTTNPLVPLLLKLSNLNRINSFSFYPATYSATVRALNSSLPLDRGQYFPLEPLYMLEARYGSTGSNGTALYMAGNAMWNWWMYEALAESSDRAIMVLNTDTLDRFEESVGGTDRRLIAYNPTGGAKTFTLQWKGLATGSYVLHAVDSAGASAAPQTYSASQLQSGVTMSLNGGDYRRLTLSHADASSRQAAIDLNRQARQRLSHAYWLLQERARDSGIDAQLTSLKGSFQTAMQSYAASDDAAALATADWILEQLGVTLTARAATWDVYQ